jgi:hypothetical protein
MSVIFDQVRISDNGQQFFINAHVNKASIYNNVYISRLTICTEDQVSEFNPLYYREHSVYQRDFVEPIKELDIVLDKEDVFENKDFSHNMFFVYIDCIEDPVSEESVLDAYPAPCITFDYGVIFNKAMNFTKEVAKNCCLHTNFIDFILNYEAMKIAIETDHYIPAIKYWSNMFKDKRTKNCINNSCSCYG